LWFVDILVWQVHSFNYYECAINRGGLKVPPGELLLSVGKKEATLTEHARADTDTVGEIFMAEFNARDTAMYKYDKKTCTPIFRLTSFSGSRTSPCNSGSLQ
jgi:hypothetical protein